MRKDTPSIQKMLNVWAIVLILWSLYRTKLSLPEWFDEFLAKPLVFITPVYWYITRIEKKDFFDALWIKKKNLFSEIYLGILIGVLFSFSAIFSNWVKNGNLDFTRTIAQTTSIQFLWVLIISLATSISEEILSRGFLLKRLFEDSKNMLMASFNASILFFILHIPILFTNEKLTGEMLLVFMVTDIMLSLAVSFIFLIRKNLILPILIHAFYNLAIILYI